MNREIEFRGLDSKGIWRYGSYAPSYNGDGKLSPSIEYIVDSNGGCLESKFVRHDSVGQFSGLKDKGGKLKVFEYDTVNYSYWIQTSPDPDSAGRTFTGIGIIIFIEGSFMVEDIKTTRKIPLHYPDLSLEVVADRKKGEPCEVCGEFVEGFETLGKPIESCVCGEECWDKIMVKYPQEI